MRTPTKLVVARRGVHIQRIHVVIGCGLLLEGLFFGTNHLKDDEQMIFAALLGSVVLVWARTLSGLGLWVGDCTIELS